MLELGPVRKNAMPLLLALSLQPCHSCSLSLYLLGIMPVYSHDQCKARKDDQDWVHLFASGPVHYATLLSHAATVVRKVDSRKLDFLTTD